MNGIFFSDHPPFGSVAQVCTHIKLVNLAQPSFLHLQGRIITPLCPGYHEN